MKYRIRLPSTGYTCGERISFMVNIDNKLSSVEITTITLLLIQVSKLCFYFVFFTIIINILIYHMKNIFSWKKNGLSTR